MVINSNNVSAVDINTTSGVVRGQTIHIQTTLLDAKIDQWLGIPYAEPPVGDLRFTYPVSYKYRKDIIDTTKPKNSCMQISTPIEHRIYGNLTFSEDCLFINIWRQTPPSEHIDSPLNPVMFWIHGGGLNTGSIFSRTYNGSALAAQGVVVVSVNYRLGKLGFMYGASDEAPGNVGLYDQLLGLKWVRDNIHRFGGDKDRVTIFGQSAGSWSVMSHILSPLSKGLFQRAILESGALMFNKDRDVISKQEALQASREMADTLNCTDDGQWVQCLRRVSPDELLKHNGFLTQPIFDSQFLPFRTQSALAKNLYNSDIDLLAGVTADEGQGLLTSLINPNDTVTADVFKMYVKLVNSVFHNIDVETVSEFYLKSINRTDSRALKHRFGDLAGDLMLKCPTYLFAKQLARQRQPANNVYFYELTYASDLFERLNNCDPVVDGVCHSADIPFVFGLPYLYPEGYEKEDYYFTRWSMKWWTDFVKNGVLDNDWAQMLGPGNVTKVKNWNPLDLTKIMQHVFDDTCDGVWQSYYL
ncbi:acetylcholinesterase-like [Oppia nitens]|uniref:acetylcholinesterase-like n=1 Tax=Oppia nitens TaxID=1686743 RepID=UPI0023DAC72E|nr:acetylcholinesterase-like [Oppia nitens]